MGFYSFLFPHPHVGKDVSLGSFANGLLYSFFFLILRLGKMSHFEHLLMGFYYLFFFPHPQVGKDVPLGTFANGLLYSFSFS
jgi:hypothetical protein